MNNYRTGYYFSLFITYIFLIPFFIPVPAQTKSDMESPQDIIRSYSDRTVEILQNSKLRDRANTEELRERLFNTLGPIVNFELMTRSALGPKARSFSKKQVKEIQQIFKPLVVNLYLDRLFAYMVHKENPWKLEKIRIESQEYKMGKRYALVRSSATVKRDDTERELSMNFKLVDQNGDWEVYDLVFEGVSLVENYRSQFSEILTNSSYKEFKNRLQVKLQEVQSTNQARSEIE